jgi:hypothetical protein
LASGIHLVDHDRLCRQPREVLASVLRVIDARADPAVIGAEIRAGRVDERAADAFSPALLERARVTHAALTSSHGNVN